MKIVFIKEQIIKKKFVDQNINKKVANRGEGRVATTLRVDWKL